MRFILLMLAALISFTGCAEPAAPTDSNAQAIRAARPAPSPFPGLPGTTLDDLLLLGEPFVEISHEPRAPLTLAHTRTHRVGTEANPASRLIIGLAHDAVRGITWARELPGERLTVLKGGAPGISSFDVPELAGCAAFTRVGEEEDVQSPCDCGLAVDWATGYLVADGRGEVYVVDPLTQSVVWSFAKPFKKVGGIGVDQRSGSVWMLDFDHLQLIQMSLRGAVLSRLSPQTALNPSVLDVESIDGKLVGVSAQGTEIVLIDLAGGRTELIPMGRAGDSGGAAAGADL